MTVPAVPGALVARSNVLCTASLPSGVSGTGCSGGLVGSVGSTPSSGPETSAAQPVAAATTSERSERVMVLRMAVSPRGATLIGDGSYCSACATPKHAADPREISWLGCLAPRSATPLVRLLEPAGVR